MTKEQAYSSAENLLKCIFSESDTICINICLAVADRNSEYITKCLDEVIDLCNTIKEGLKDK